MAARPPSVSDVSLSLTLAVVGSSTAPLLLLDGDLTVISASASFCTAFGIDPATVQGIHISDLGEGEWRAPQLRVLLSATAAGEAEIEAYEMDLKIGDGPIHRLVVNAHKLDYGDEEPVRLLVAVADVTDARAAAKLKDDLLREKAILLQEVQHRVANSLQIIASVLLQSARKVQSDETRGHLKDAHSRVMSVAAVQKQLSASRLGDVALKSYFTRLCESLSASMIPDADQLTLEVTCDGTRVGGDISVSLGLIVTELVINALKHAFPRHRKGHITVDYRSNGPNWTLTVCDDGVGMPHGEHAPKPGLGTSIVEAVARQLAADVRITDGQPGTHVAIVHALIAAVPDEARQRSADVAE
jgi:two-component sensor histidine kinase